MCPYRALNSSDVGASGPTSAAVSNNTKRSGVGASAATRRGDHRRRSRLRRAVERHPQLDGCGRARNTARAPVGDAGFELPRQQREAEQLVHGIDEQVLVRDDVVPQRAVGILVEVAVAHVAGRPGSSSTGGARPLAEILLGVLPFDERHLLAAVRRPHNGWPRRHSCCLRPASHTVAPLAERVVLADPLERDVVSGATWSPNGERPVAMSSTAEGPRQARRGDRRTERARSRTAPARAQMVRGPPSTPSCHGMRGLGEVDERTPGVGKRFGVAHGTRETESRGLPTVEAGGPGGFVERGRRRLPRSARLWLPAVVANVTACGPGCDANSRCSSSSSRAVVARSRIAATWPSSRIASSASSAARAELGASRRMSSAALRAACAAAS